MRGTCEICGCTEERACDGGCHWSNREQTICSQCIGWATLKPPHSYEGVFPHGLVPIRFLMPEGLWNHHTRKTILAFMVDIRRLDEETLRRVAFIAAGVNGCTVEDIIDGIAREWRFPLDARCINAVFTGDSLEEAAAAAREYAATGKVAHAVESIVCATLVERKGGVPHG